MTQELIIMFNLNLIKEDLKMENEKLELTLNVSGVKLTMSEVLKMAHLTKALYDMTLVIGQGDYDAVKQIATEFVNNVKAEGLKEIVKVLNKLHFTDTFGQTFDELLDQIY